MKFKLGLLLVAMVVALSAVVGVAAPSAEAKRGGSTTVEYPAILDASHVFTVTSFKVVNGTLVAVGTVGGQAASAEVLAINGQTLGAAGASSAITQQATCEILDLTLGPLHLDLLGLVIDLDEVHLEINAEQGPGNLLGNLLCAVAGLLDNTGGPGGGLQGLLQAIANLLNQILGALG